MVPHKRLIMKLTSYGINNQVIEWVKQFLEEREQFCVALGTSNSKSPWSEVRGGVPQGSVLGPVLFLTYIYDLPREVASFIKLFADDSKLLHKLAQPIILCKMI